MGATIIEKQPSITKNNMLVARKSIHLSQNLSSNHIITENDVTMKRPGDG